VWNSVINLSINVAFAFNIVLFKTNLLSLFVLYRMTSILLLSESHMHIYNVSLFIFHVMVFLLLQIIRYDK
jgi:hypothetical protein